MLHVEEGRAKTNLKRPLIESQDSILGTKPYPQAYTKEVLKNINLINFSNSNKSEPFGSYIYRVQKYPGDIDLIETYTTDGTYNDVIHKFKNKLITIVKNIVKNRLHYMIEFKMGIDKIYDFSIGSLKNGIYNPSGLIFNVYKLYNEHLLTHEEFDTVNAILSSNRVLNSDDYDVIFNLFREKRILRWTDKNILDGYIITQSGYKKTIEEALKDKTAVKIDMITKINNSLVEITNFLLLTYDYVLTDENNNKILDDKGNEIIKHHLINFGDDLTFNYLSNEMEKQLPEEIEKLFFSKYYFNPFKGAKRLWALARHYKDWHILNKIKNLISGNISMLYMLKSELGTIIRLSKELIKYKHRPPIATINNNLDLIKSKIGYILDINKDRYYNFVNLINTAIDTSHLIGNKISIVNKIKVIKKGKIDLLEDIENLFSNIINMNTIGYLNTQNLLILPSLYLPKYPKYRTSNNQQIKMI